jgi:hypothetical protein
MTLNEMIKTIKAENPTLQIGDEERGYTELTGADYDLVIRQWAEARLAKTEKQIESEAVAQAKLDAVEKLTALGIDPKALGL